MSQKLGMSLIASSDAVVPLLLYLGMLLKSVESGDEPVTGRGINFGERRPHAHVALGALILLTLTSS